MNIRVNQTVDDDINSANKTAHVKSSTVIVIGSGPVGIRFIEELLRHCPDSKIILFGDESCKPYNRVQLSALLAGEISRDAIDLPLPNQNQYKHFSFIPIAITNIDRANKTVTDATGTNHLYDHLVIATGAKAHRPNIYGVELQGVFSFRSLKDTESLYARILRSRHIVVVGGGLLGLEAAKGLLKYNTQVTVVQQGPRLMNRQLDYEAADLLEKEVRSLGINVVTNSGVRSIHGLESVSGVVTRNGKKISCDTVLFCAGITPNINIARDARLKISTGIVVNDQLQTSDSSIYAIGECCEHKGNTYGLVNPGYEQAAIAAANIAATPSQATLIATEKNTQPRYQGSLSISHLKVVGTAVSSLGEVSDLPYRPFQKEIRYRHKKFGEYRKLVVHKGKIIGAVAIGEWPEARRVQEAYQNERPIKFWQRLRFRFTGKLWGGQTNNIQTWPDNTIVCQCNQVSYGQLSEAVLTGCKTISALQECTKAGTVCGSCKPLMQQLVCTEEPAEKETGASPLMIGACLALILISVIALWPEAQVSNSVQQSSWFEALWNDKFWKQTTGFTLLGMTAVGLLMSLRKRLAWAWMGNFSHWRIAHTLLGLMCCIGLILHSGFHLGENLNKLLMLNFLAILLMGALSSGVIGISHKLSLVSATTSRKYTQWLHIIVSWPLPVLLTFHILSVYYF